MSIRRVDTQQPENFIFTVENKKWAKAQITKYPKGRKASAIISLLWQAQKQTGGWLPEPAIRYVADLLGMSYMRALEVASFYTMFNLSPVGKHFVQLCGTTPCWLRGAEELKEVCKKYIGEEKKISEDGQLSWQEVECLGACVNAPMVQINDDFYEDLTPERLETLLSELRQDKPVKTGPQNHRKSSEPESGQTVLKSNQVDK